MYRRVMLLLAAVSLVAVSDWAAAQPVSWQNPYRSFNISGVNYGSQRWEQSHRSRRQAGHAPRKWRARRW